MTQVFGSSTTEDELHMNLLVLVDRSYMFENNAPGRTSNSIGTIVDCSGEPYPGTPEGSMLLQLIAGGKFVLLERYEDRLTEAQEAQAMLTQQGQAQAQAQQVGRG